MLCYCYWSPNKIKMKRSFRWSSLEGIGEFASGSFMRVLGQMSVISRPKAGLGGKEQKRGRTSQGQGRDCFWFP